MKRPGSRKHGTKKFLGVVLAVGIIAAGTYAFTASNTVPATNAGDGAQTISGYTVSNVQYNQAVGDPTTISSYTFTLDATARVVNAKIDASQLTYDTCTNVLLVWTCTPVAPVPVTDADNLRVIAVQ